MPFDVIGLGAAVSDQLINIDAMPEKNKTAPIYFESWQFGGKAATAMASLARMGVSCSMISVLGEDDNGRAQLKDFAFNGVDTSHMIIDPAYDTASCIAISERKTEARCFLYQKRNLRRARPDELDKDMIGSAKYLLIHYVDETTMLAADYIHETGGTVVFDADSYDPTVETAFSKIDVLIASEMYAEGFRPGSDPVECCHAFINGGVSTGIVTLGEKGGVGITPAGGFNYPAFEVDVIDTTGAGDVFHGGYIYGLLNGWEPEECARWASAMSAIKCSSIGGRSGLPTREMVERFLKDGYIDRAEIERRVAHYALMPHQQ